MPGDGLQLHRRPVPRATSSTAIHRHRRRRARRPGQRPRHLHRRRRRQPIRANNVVSGNRGDAVWCCSTAPRATSSPATSSAWPATAPRSPAQRGSGVLIVGADGNTLEANVIGGNGGFGVAMAGTSGNVLTGNLIGVDRDGTPARPNALHGVMVFAASGNTLSGNVISANMLYGVELPQGARRQRAVGELSSAPTSPATRRAATPCDGVQLDGAIGEPPGGQRHLRQPARRREADQRLLEQRADRQPARHEPRPAPPRWATPGSGVLIAGGLWQRHAGQRRLGQRRVRRRHRRRLGERGGRRLHRHRPQRLRRPWATACPAS